MRALVCGVTLALVLWVSPASPDPIPSDRSPSRHYGLRGLERWEDRNPAGENATGAVAEHLRAYRASHGANAVIGDPNVCTRSFVLVSYPELDSLGNNVYSFLNGFLLSVLMDRTLVLAAPHAAVPFPTPPWPSSWIIDLPRLKGLWARMHCKPVYLAAVMIGTPTKADHLTCCGEKFLDYALMTQCLNHHHLYQFSGPDAVLNDASRRVANILFSLDEYTLYGLLMRAAFQLGAPSVGVQGALARVPLLTTLKIGLHLRHLEMNSGQIQMDIDIAVASLRRVVSAVRTGHDQPCAILLASNRPEVFETSALRPLGCSIVYVDRPMANASVLNKTSEHGLWSNSNIQVDDINLLAMADVFVGSSIFKKAHSTFSMLIADLLSSRHGSGRGRVYWISDIPANSSEAWDSTTEGSHSIGRVVKPKDCQAQKPRCPTHTSECHRHKTLLEMQKTRFVERIKG